MERCRIEWRFQEKNEKAFSWGKYQFFMKTIFFMQLSYVFLEKVGSDEELDPDMWVPSPRPFHGQSNGVPMSSGAAHQPEL